jgi:hypothetical protein
LMGISLIVLKNFYRTVMPISVPSDSDQSQSNTLL